MSEPKYVNLDTVSIAKLTEVENSPARGVNWLNCTSLQCVPWATLVRVRHLFDTFNFEVFGNKMIPKRKIFENPSDIFLVDSIHASWPNMLKIGYRKVDKTVSGIGNKKPAAPRTRPSPPFFPHWADRTQNFLNVVAPRSVHVCQIGPEWLRYAAVIPKGLIFWVHKVMTTQDKACIQAFSVRK